MRNSKRLWRALLFFVLTAALCGSFALPVVNLDASAAPKYQVTVCLGTKFTEWTFENVTTPSTGAGAFTSGSGLPTPQFSAGSPGQAVSFDNWTTSASVDANDYVQFAVPTNGRNTIQLDLEYRATGTGPQNLEVDYSVDGGTNFVPLGSPIPLTRDSNFHSLTLDFSGIQALNDNPNAIFKIYGYAATGNAGSLRLDNVAFSGNCINPAPPATAAPALAVIINEVAWSGTAASASDEWFELYNNTGADINLNGWSLRADDGNPDIALSGTMTAADPYFVVARNANLFSDMQPDLVDSSFAFSNNGEILYLLDPNGNQVDTANLDGGAWNAGSAAPSYASMERKGVIPDGPTAWATYGGTTPVAHDRNGNNIKGTPGQGNWILSVTATPSPTNTGTATATGTRTNTPLPAAYHSVIINEIAWSGTKASADDEWIELYNTTNNPIDLTGWVLKSDDNTPRIDTDFIGMTIPAKGFLLLARKSGTFRDVTPDIVYGDTGTTHTLTNNGEVLRLKGPSGTDVDVANSYSGYGFSKWAAGTGTPNYQSMERASFSLNSPADWFTFGGTPFAHDRSNNLINGTPGRANWALTITATPSPKPTSTFRPTPTRTLSPPPPPPLIAINEFVPRPGHDWNHDGVVNVGDEYIELLNHGTVDVNLSGYRLDDEVNVGSPPYSLPAKVLKPGERFVVFGSESGLLLGDGGDGVRLLKPNGQLMDAYNYSVVRYPDQSYCRLPDNGGADDWNQNCYPTPGLQNSLSGESSSTSTSVGNESLCPIADTLPDDFVFAECDPYGNNIWRPEFWDESGWYHERDLPGIDSKWPVYAN